MEMVSKEIEKYCLSVSDYPSDICSSLEAYTRANVPMSIMLIGPVVGSILGFLISLVRVRRVLEVGCFTGYSALVMAERLPEDGELITLDINPETNDIAKKFWAQSPHGRKIRSVLGPASETLPELTAPFDLVFIDADKTGYVDYLRLVLPLLSTTGLVVADNCLYGGGVLEPSPSDEGAKAIKRFNAFVKTNPALESTLLPIRDGLHLIRKK